MSAPTFWQRLLNWLKPDSKGTTTSPKPPDREAVRHQRAQHRTQLQAVVRENMIRAGVLSGAYRFKTLPLDRAGRTFAVLFDVDAQAMDTDAQTLAELEHDLQTFAQQRHGIEVKGAYWKIHHPSGTKPTHAAPRFNARQTPPR